MNSQIVQLRQLLADRFPHLRTWTDTPPAPSCWKTGVERLDTLLHGGLAKGSITEIVGGNSGRDGRAAPSASGTGSGLLLHALIEQAHATQQIIVLIDAADSFDPCSFAQETLSRLLWVRCKNAAEALKATDIILRDRNLPLVLLDLKMNPAAQLRKISGTIWYRLQRIVQQNGTSFVVFTPNAMVSSTEVRLTLNSHFDITALSQTPEELVPELHFNLDRENLRAVEVG
ncbi:MAG: hypothetical protein JWO95_2175 [Verrucomicrobiales bacterium]|nr:hypothetical protein [Verrucomicrobiales bacterium]